MELGHIVLLCCAAALAVAYGMVWVGRPVSLWRSAIKTGSTVLLAVVALLLDLPLWALALGLGAVGDWFLSRDPDTGFLPGLVAFAAGHLTYLVLLWPLVDTVSLIAGAVFGLIALLVAMRHWHALGDLRIPVSGYAAISAGLGACAVSLPEGFEVLRLGVLAFIVSDVILSEDLFLLPEGDWRQPVYARLLWSLYWGGQALILVGAYTALGLG